MTATWFEYHCFESEDSADVEAWRRTHQRVVVMREVDADEEVGPMYRVRFSDGHEHDVFSDELLASPAEFTRPDYATT